MRRNKGPLGIKIIPKDQQPMDLDESYTLTDNGTFVKNGYNVNKDGIKSSPNGWTKRMEVKASELKIKQVIGQGVSGKVYYAIHEPTDTHLALKFISIVDASAKRDQILKELKAMEAIEDGSRYLVQYLGAFVEDRHIVIPMELMDLGSFADVIKRAKKIPETILGQFAAQLLKGLAFLNSKGIMHRDVKPGNILCNSRGELKYIDFGIMTDFDASSLMTRTYVGTCTYMSPERLASKPYNKNCDVWSIGLVIHEAATGKYPYKSEHFMQLVSEILESPSPRLSEDKFSISLRSFTESCLTHDNALRPTAAKLLEENRWIAQHDAEVNVPVVQLFEWLAHLPPPNNNNNNNYNNNNNNNGSN